MKDSLNKSIVVAQDAADNLRVQAQSESNSIIAEASQKGQLIIEAAKKKQEQSLIKLRMMHVAWFVIQMI